MVRKMPKMWTVSWNSNFMDLKEQSVWNCSPQILKGLHWPCDLKPSKLAFTQYQAGTQMKSYLEQIRKNTVPSILRSEARLWTYLSFAHILTVTWTVFLPHIIQNNGYTTFLAYQKMCLLNLSRSDQRPSSDAFWVNDSLSHGCNFLLYLLLNYLAIQFSVEFEINLTLKVMG